MGAKLVRVPRLFYEDHTEGRLLPAPPPLEVSARTVTIDVRHPFVKHLLDDAQFYADPRTMDECPAELRRSAKAMVRALTA